MINLNNVNERLRSIYGLNPHRQPMFRIIFSDRELEKRFGVFAEWYGKIFIREFRGLREVPKYSYLKGKWVLERWISPLSIEGATGKEIDLSGGTYEPIYVFQDAAGNSLPVIEDFVHKIIDKLFNPALPGDRASQLKTADEEAYRKEIEYNIEVFADASPYLAGKLRAGEAIIVP